MNMFIATATFISILISAVNGVLRLLIEIGKMKERGSFAPA